MMALLFCFYSILHLIRGFQWRPTTCAVAGQIESTQIFTVAHADQIDN
jgi:hypothetical protein